jgi:hypothetical protein
LAARPIYDAPSSKAIIKPVPATEKPPHGLDLKTVRLKKGARPGDGSHFDTRL